MTNVHENAAFSFPPAASTNPSTLTHRIKFSQFLQSPNHHQETSSSECEDRSSSSSSTSTSRRPSHEYNNITVGHGSHSPGLNYNSYGGDNISTPSPYWTHSSQYSPYTNSPWLNLSPDLHHQQHHPHIQLIGSLVREEGHVYSLATSSYFLYTGSDSRNIRVWTKSRLHDSGGFKSSSGLVKSIIVGPDNKVFTGHQDGKIRIWQGPEDPTTKSSSSSSSSSTHRRVGSLPKWRDYLRSWVDPTRRNEGRHGKKGSVNCQHFDAVSCLSFDSDATGLLYSASWDKTVKVWRLKDSKCVDSIKAHDDAVNAVVAAGFGELVFTGSADGTVKVWRREVVHNKKTIRHVYIDTLMEQKSAVTSLAVMSSSGKVYAGSSDGLVNFWEWEKTTGMMRYGGVLRGHKLAVLCLATAGSLVLSGSADNTICVWKSDEAGIGGGGGRDHVCLSVLTGHNGPIKCLAVDENFDTAGGSSYEELDDNVDGVVSRRRRWRVYSGSLDNSVKVWMVPEEEEFDLITHAA